MITKGSHKTAEERYHAYKQELVKAAAGLNQPIDIEKLANQTAQLSGYDGQSTPGLSNTPSPVNNPKYENLFKPKRLKTWRITLATHRHQPTNR